MNGGDGGRNGPKSMQQKDLNIIFDNQIFMNQQRGGISRYFVELIRHLPRVDPQICAPFPGRWATNDHVLEAAIASAPPGLPVFRRYMRPSAARARALAQMSQRVRKLKKQFQTEPSLYHPTYYSQKEFLRDDLPVVVTVYDMIPELFPEMFVRNPHREKSWFLKRADSIIAISESAARDVRKFFPNLTTPIDVVPLAVDMSHFSLDGDRVDSFPRPWVLFVGNRAGYKDFDVLLQAMARDVMREVHVVVLSARGPKSEERATIARLGLEGRVTFVSATDEQLGAFYRGADAFVFPSRYEGFGLPTLEALACGAPTILARSSSHPEVGGDACLYFEPGDADMLAERLTELLSDNALRHELRQRGIERTTTFSWERTARLTAAVYRRLAESGRR